MYQALVVKLSAFDADYKIILTSLSSFATRYPPDLKHRRGGPSTALKVEQVRIRSRTRETSHVLNKYFDRAGRLSRWDPMENAIVVKEGLHLRIGVCGAGS